MTRKHFEALALALGRKRANWREDAAWERGFNDAVDTVMDVCAMQNGRFNRDTFKAAVLAAGKDAV